MKKFSGAKYAATIRAAIESHESLIERRRALQIEQDDTKILIKETERALEKYPDMPHFDKTLGTVPTAEEIDRMVADHTQKRLDLEQALNASRMKLRLLRDAWDAVHKSVAEAEGKIKAARVDYAKALEVHTLGTLDVEQFSNAIRQLGAAYQVAFNARLADEWYSDLLKLTPSDEDLAAACSELQFPYG
jgi:tetratricopeptide (TPR) repeat protein